MSGENVKVVRRGFGATMEADWATALDTMHGEIEIHDFDIPDAGLYHGHEGYFAWLAQWDEGWDTWRVEGVEIRPAGDDQVIRTRRRAAKLARPTSRVRRCRL